MTRADGTFARLTKRQIAVEGNLYTFTDEGGAKNTEIESWFSSEIEAPFSPILKQLAQLQEVRKKGFKPDEKKFRMVEEIGFEVLPYLEYIDVTPEQREVISSYVAALLVRSPKYIGKIQAFHNQVGGLDEAEIKNISLKNMLYVYEIYKAAILKADFSLVVRAGEHEFLFSDGGIAAREPWSSVLMPFDLHVPLTPDVSLGVLPYNERDPSVIAIARAKNRAISYHNRETLSTASRFVYSRGYPPVDFIKRYFGVPAPLVFGYRQVHGRLETRFEPQRDPYRR